MARPQKSIPLKRPFEDGAGGMVRKILLQEPSGSDYFALGAPRTWVKASGGMALVDNDDTIRAYIERCIVEPDPLLAMAQISVLDAIAVKDVLLDFFQEPATKPAPDSRTTSEVSATS